MASAEIIEEISQFYDIKQQINEYDNIYYITYRGINIDIGIKFPSGYYKSAFNTNIETLRKYIDRNILLIDKLNEIFEFISKIDPRGYEIIQVGSAEIHFQYINNIQVYNVPFHKNYDNVCDVIEFLKEHCPECIKLGDIKIALKD